MCAAPAWRIPFRCSARCLRIRTPIPGAAVAGSIAAGYYQLATDDPVMALGGFGSADPAPPLEQFEAYVADRRIRYYIDPIGTATPHFRPPGVNEPTEADHIRDWVKQHFTGVTIDGVTRYDLTKPLAGGARKGRRHSGFAVQNYGVISVPACDAACLICGIVRAP